MWHLCRLTSFLQNQQPVITTRLRLLTCQVELAQDSVLAHETHALTAAHVHIDTVFGMSASTVTKPGTEVMLIQAGNEHSCILCVCTCPPRLLSR
jgi:hypothetical protein